MLRELGLRPVPNMTRPAVTVLGPSLFSRWTVKVPSSFFSILHQTQSAQPQGSGFCKLDMSTANRHDRHEWRLLSAFVDLEVKCQTMSNEAALQVAW